MARLRAAMGAAGRDGGVAVADRTASRARAKGAGRLELERSEVPESPHT